MSEPLSKQEAMKKIREIYRNFLHKIKEIEIERDKKVLAIIKKAEQRQIEEIRKKLANL